MERDPSRSATHIRPLIASSPRANLAVGSSTPAAGSFSSSRFTVHRIRRQVLHRCVARRAIHCKPRRLWPGICGEFDGTGGSQGRLSVAVGGGRAYRKTARSRRRIIHQAPAFRRRLGRLDALRRGDANHRLTRSPHRLPPLPRATSRPGSALKPDEKSEHISTDQPIP